MTTLQRTLLSDVSVRSDGRTVYGIAVPFGVPAKVNDGYGPYTETISRGAFAKTIKERGERVKLCVNHDKMRTLPIGRATLLREDTPGLYGEFRVSRTAAGDDALTLIRDGVVDSFSVGFQPVKERKVDRGVVERTEVALSEVSVVGFPAYHGAAIHGLRAELAAIDPDDFERLADLLRTTPDLLALLAERAAGTSTEEAAGTDTSTEDTTDEGAPPEAVIRALAEEAVTPAEPADATRADEPTGPVPYQPTSRPVVTHDRRKAQRDDVRALLDQLTRSA